MKHNTYLEELKATYPNLDYCNEAFYESPQHEDYLCEESTSDNIDADYVIIQHYRFYEEDKGIPVDSNWIKEVFGSFDKAFLKAFKS